jgi:hypothetical protein
MTSLLSLRYAPPHPHAHFLLTSPLVQVFDAHSLWHATALLTALFWHHFILWDLGTPTPSKGGDSVTLLIVLLGIVAYLQVVVFVVIKLK